MTNERQDTEKYNQVTARCLQGASSWLARCRIFLSALLLMAAGVAWGQSVVVFHNASIGGTPGVSMAWTSNNNDGCKIMTRNDSDPKQQWIMEDAGDSKIYLKNVSSGTYLYRVGNNNWTMAFCSAGDLAGKGDNAKFQRRTDINSETGQFTIQTSYTLLGPNNGVTASNSTCYGDKSIGNGQVYWTLGICPPVIAYTPSTSTCTITCATAEVTIYYTTDGTDPTTGSTEYTGPFSVTEGIPVKAIAVKEGYDNSTVSSRNLIDLNDNHEGRIFHLYNVNSGLVMTYDHDGDGPTQNQDGCQIKPLSASDANQKWTVEDDDDGYFYLKNVGSNKYLGCINVNNNYWLMLFYDNISSVDENLVKFKFVEHTPGADFQIILKKHGTKGLGTDATTAGSAVYGDKNTVDKNIYWTVSLAQPVTPTITYDNETGKATIVTAAPVDAIIYYTTDGSDPTTGSTQYTGPIEITSTTTIKAIAVRNGLDNSEVVTKTIEQVATPTIQLGENGYTVVMATATPNATIYYTTDGSTPTTGSAQYTGPISEDITGKTFKAIATYTGFVTSEVGSGGPFELRCATPVIIQRGKSIEISCEAPEGAIIYYTTDGSDPTTSSTQYTGTVDVSGLSLPFTIKAYATADGYDGSNIATEGPVDSWGDGSADNPYIISSADDFSQFITDVNESDDKAASHYVIANNITLSGNTSATRAFTGELYSDADENGQFYAISGLSQPIFNTVNGGTVKNLILSDVNISSGTNVGAIAGEATGATRIYNCGVLGGSVNSTGGAAGGLVGHIASGSSVRVVNCYNYANVSGGTYAAGIVGYNEGTIGDTRIAMCMMYGKLTSGTVKSPVYAGTHVSNNQDYTEYNYWRYRAYSADETTYTAYNDQLAIGKDEWLTRFPFYCHILNTHRELAAFFLFHDSKKSSVSSATAPTADEVAEIGHWVLNTSVAPYPVIEPWQTNTKKTTVDIVNNLPNTTEKGKGKLLNNIGDDGYYTGNGTKVTAMGNSGYLTVSVSINGSFYSVNLPITDMNEDKYDYTWGKVVLPFANEFDGWSRDYTKICTGWKITRVTGGTEGTLSNYNFADRDCTAKDLYSNSNYIFAQGGNYIVPYGVTAITIEANFANAYYLSDAQGDFGYNDTYGGQTGLGWAVPTTYHEQTVYTSLSTLVGKLSNSTNPHSQAIVLVGNFHYNQNVINKCFDTGKACTVMSVDEDNNQEPDYGWYAYHNQSSGRTALPSIRFDFLPNIGMGMAARVTNSTPNPTIGILQCTGSFELTETCVSYMSECEIEGNTGMISTDEDGNGNNRYIVNSGYFIQIVRAQEKDVSKLSYIKVGGNAFIKQLYPGCHSNKANTVKLVPIIVTGGEMEECYMTGYKSGGTAWGTDIRFWCAGGKIGKFLGAYLDKPRQTTSSDGNVNMTAKVDHACIGRFFGGGTSTSARITGNIDITMNNSQVDFYCGGPEFGDMESGKTVTTNAVGTTFGEYYGAGFGGTSITKVRGENASGNNDGQQEVSFSNATFTYPLAFSNYHYLTNKAGYGFGVNYDFEYIQYAGGDGKGVARFYTGYAQFSLATTGNVTNTLSHCIIQNDFYGAGCQGKVDGTVTSTLTDCTVNGSVFGGGYKAENNTLEVYPNTQPTYSVYTKETGLFSDFGTVEPETWTWVAGSGNANTTNKTLPTGMTEEVMNTLGNVTGAISLTIDGNSKIETDGSTDADKGNVYGGGNESRSLSAATLTIKGNTEVLGSVFGGGNKADVAGKATVNIEE